MTVGCIEDARQALAGNGRWLGEGTTRTCYLINGIVYKVQHYSQTNDNDSEWENYRLWLTLKDSILNFPATYLWKVGGTDVIAMEYISGEDIDQNDEEWIYEQFPHSDDICVGNILVNQHGYWLIDMGC